MRPQDIVVLLKIAISQPGWMGKDLAADLFLSQAEISYSLNRSAQTHLIDQTKKRVMRRTLLEFIQYGLPHAFPAVRGPMAVGVATAYSSPVIASRLMVNDSAEKIVWPCPEGETRGESISPLYPNLVKAALKDVELYELLALVDVMRVGRVREKEIAMRLLRNIILVGRPLQT